MGVTGPVGPKRRRRRAWSNRPDGREGRQGAQGFVGPQGPEGKIGTQGDSGNQGETGATGAAGEAGNTRTIRVKRGQRYIRTSNTETDATTPKTVGRSRVPAGKKVVGGGFTSFNHEFKYKIIRSDLQTKFWSVNADRTSGTETGRLTATAIMCDCVIKIRRALLLCQQILSFTYEDIFFT